MEEAEQMPARTPKGLASKIPLAKAITEARTIEQTGLPAKPRYKVPINAKVTAQK
jgi:hypothetical protein